MTRRCISKKVEVIDYIYLISPLSVHNQLALVIQLISKNYLNDEKKSLQNPSKHLVLRPVGASFPACFILCEETTVRKSVSAYLRLCFSVFFACIAECSDYFTVVQLIVHHCFDTSQEVDLILYFNGVLTCNGSAGWKYSRQLGAQKISYLNHSIVRETLSIHELCEQFPASAFGSLYTGW